MEIAAHQVLGPVEDEKVIEHLPETLRLGDQRPLDLAGVSDAVGDAFMALLPRFGVALIDLDASELASDIQNA